MTMADAFLSSWPIPVPGPPHELNQHRASYSSGAGHLGTPQVCVCTPGLCVHRHKCSLCKVVKWAVGVRPCAGTREGPKPDKES